MWYTVLLYTEGAARFLVHRNSNPEGVADTAVNTLFVSYSETRRVRRRARTGFWEEVLVNLQMAPVSRARSGSLVSGFHRIPSVMSPYRLFGRSLLPILLVAGALTLTGCGDSGGDEADVPYEVGSALSDSTLALVVSSEHGSDTLRAQQYQKQAKQQLAGIPPQAQSPDTVQSIHRELVRSVAAQHAMQSQAEADDVQIDTTRVNKQLAKIKQRYQSEEQFRAQLAQNNMTVDSLRNYITQQLQTRQLQQQMAETAESPTDTEVEEYSKENARIRAQHILLRLEEDAPQAKADSARQVAETLIDSAQAGADFAELARRHSEGPSAEQGGDLGAFSRDDMVESFSEAAFALADSGDIAPEPVRTEFGFHVIRLTSPPEPMDTTEARNAMMKERRREAFERELDDLLQQVTVRANPDVVEAGFYS